MEFDLVSIINTLATIIGAGSFYGGMKYGYDKYKASKELNEKRYQDEMSFSNINNTGKMQSLDIVTGQECRETRKGITDSIHDVRQEVKEGLGRNTEQLSKLYETVNGVRQALASQEAAIIKSVGFGVREHERRFHRLQSSSGEYKKVEAK